jgi:hypothetical protein
MNGLALAALAGYGATSREPFGALAPVREMG